MIVNTHGARAGIFNYLTGRAICQTPRPVDEAEALLDGYRTEVLAKAIGRLRAIPVDCTALTGPVWYGDGWNSAITVLEEIADYQSPDDEAYPGELQRLRALAVALRVAALRKEDMAEVRRVLVAHADFEIAARGKAATAGADTVEFFQPGHTYSREHHGDTAEFDVRHIEPAPDGGQVAFGFYRRQPHTSRHPYSSDDLADWADVTGEVTA